VYKSLLWMAAGVPLIARRSAVLEDIVEDGVCGYLVEPGCPERMAEKVMHLAFHPEVLVRMSNAARDRVKNYFTLEGGVSRFIELIGNVIASGNSHIRG